MGAGEVHEIKSVRRERVGEAKSRGQECRVIEHCMIKNGEKGW